MKHAEYRVIQHGAPVASVIGPEPGAWREILHYAAVYAQDGPCTIQRKSNGRWVNEAEYLAAA